MQLSKGELRIVRACFGGTTKHFDRYQYLNFLVFLPLVIWGVAAGKLTWMHLTCAVLMGAFDLPAILIGGIAFMGFQFLGGRQEFTAMDGAVLAAGLFFGYYFASMLHNAVHKNYRPKWLNRPIGEITAFLTTYGYVPFRTTHQLHHAFTDKPLDPHSPRGKTLIEFALQVRKQITNGMKTTYIMGSEDGPGAATKRWTVIEVLLKVNRIFRFTLLLLIFGPHYFSLFFLPCYVGNFLLFTYYNYVMHMHEGEIELQNLNDNWHRKLINFFCHGVLFHKNHHTHCHFFDPRDMDSVQLKHGALTPAVSKASPDSHSLGSAQGALAVDRL